MRRVPAMAVLATAALATAALWAAAAPAPPRDERFILVMSEAAEDRTPATLELAVRDGRIDPQGWLTAYAYNLSQHPATVTVGEVAGPRLRVSVRVQVQADPSAPGGPAAYDLDLARQGDTFTGTCVGTFIDQRVRGSVAGRAAVPLVYPLPDVALPAPGEHPRLIFRKKDLPAIRKRLDTPEGKAILEMLKTRAPLREPSQVTDRHSSWMAANWGAISQLTGDADAAGKARAVLMDEVITKPLPADRKDIHHASRLLGIALTYDLCHDAWDADFRRLVAEYMHVVAADLALGFHEGFQMDAGAFDPNPAGHRNAIRMACVGVAAIALAGDVDGQGKPLAGVEPLLVAAERHVTNYLRLGITRGGAGLEGGFYRNFALANGVLQYLHAARVARGRDLSLANPCLLAGDVLAARAAPAGPQDFGLSSISIQASGLWPMGLSSVPRDLLPVMKWCFDHDAGLAGKQHFGCAYPYQAAYALATYPFDVQAKPPGAALPLAVNDPEHGHFLLRDRWQDADDTTVELFLNLHSRPALRTAQRPRTDAGDLTTGVLNVSGLGAAWLRGFWGPPRLNDAIGADLLYAQVQNQQAVIGMDLTRTLTVAKASLAPIRPRTAKGPAFGHGRLPTVEEIRGFLSTTRPADPPRPAPGPRPGADRPSSDMTLVRHLAVDLSGECGAPLLLAIVDKSAGVTAPWRVPLASPPASTSAGRFLAGDSAGANLVGHFIAPVDTRLSGAQVPARPEYFVILTLQRGAAPSPRIEGTGLAAKVTLGRRTIAFDGQRIVLGR